MNMTPKELRTGGKNTTYTKSSTDFYLSSRCPKICSFHSLLSETSIHLSWCCDTPRKSRCHKSELQIAKVILTSLILDTCLY